jgi:hypothetical protein
MTEAQEKAVELIDKYRTYIRAGAYTYEYLDPEDEVHLSKQCALIAVDEILESQPSYVYWRTYYDETPSAITYWQEVKEAITNYKRES